MELPGQNVPEPSMEPQASTFSPAATENGGPSDPSSTMIEPQEPILTEAGPKTAAIATSIANPPPGTMDSKAFDDLWDQLVSDEDDAMQI